MESFAFRLAEARKNSGLTQGQVAENLHITTQSVSSWECGNSIPDTEKLLDRCNNISSMATSFTDEHMAEYIKETQEYIHPLMKRARDEYPEYSNQLFLIRYHMNSVLETVRHHMRAGL